MTHRTEIQLTSWRKFSISAGGSPGLQDRTRANIPPRAGRTWLFATGNCPDVGQLPERRSATGVSRVSLCAIPYRLRCLFPGKGEITVANRHFGFPERLFGQ
jgi:hypothetical protein